MILHQDIWRIDGPYPHTPPMLPTLRFRPKDMLKRPVINQTGISGVFDFYLEFDTNAPLLESQPDPLGRISMSGALLDQLGLKLEPAIGPGDVIVIDHLERPFKNQ